MVYSECSECGCPLARAYIEPIRCDVCCYAAWEKARPRPMKWRRVTPEEPAREVRCLLGCTTPPGPCRQEEWSRPSPTTGSTVDFVALGYRKTDEVGEYWTMNDDFWDGDAPVFWIPLPEVPEE